MLKDLALTKEELKAREAMYKDGPAVAGGEEGQPIYPWGLSFSMCEKSLGKMGLSASDFEAGETREMSIVAKVTRVESIDTDSGKSESVGFTIIAAEIGGRSNTDAAKKSFYGEKNGEETT